MTKLPHIGFISLGCPKALVDSERLLTQLRAEGYVVSPSYQQADLVIVNTCGFIDAAKDESLATIDEALQQNGRVIVTGCLGARPEIIQQPHPKVLAITGPQADQEVMAVVHQHLPAPHEPFANLLPSHGVKLTPHHYAYLKISEGCNQQCSFCIIPQLRGKLVSRPIGEVLREAEQLVHAGVRELLIVSQDTGAYGIDRQYHSDLWQGKLIETRIQTLAEQLGQLPAWIRLHYLYPYPHLDHLIPLMAAEQILPYLDIPLQHASPTILKQMRRPAASEQMLDRIVRWRQECPELTLRSTFIVGFPGETEADFALLLDFLQQAQLDRVGCFPYSPVEGAPANALPNPVPEEVKQERLARFMDAQAKISAERLAAKIGSFQTVLVDEVLDDQLIARSTADAPEIDGQVFVPGAWEAEPGDFIQVRITEADAYDLWGEIQD